VVGERTRQVFSPSLHGRLCVSCTGCDTWNRFCRPCAGKEGRPLIEQLKDFAPSLITAAGVLILLWTGLWLAVRAVRRSAKKHAGTASDVELWANQLIGFFRRTVEIASVLVVVLALLPNLGHGVTRITWDGISEWLTGPGVHILFILLFAYMVVRAIDFSINRFQVLLLARTAAGTNAGERQKRVNTIGRLFRAVAVVLVAGCAILMALRQINVDITPILTGAGVAGVAVGFGAQNLVRDIISGLFLILEDQVRVGDVAQINGKGGLVEAIHLRTIVLRDEDGTVHIFPNGAVTSISNMTKDYSFALLKIGVSYKENTDEVAAVLKRVGEEVEHDPEFAPKILAPIEYIGVDSFADSAVILKIRMKTLPIMQWGVARELRRRIKLEFDRLGIEMPYPHVSIGMASDSPPLALRMAAAGAASPDGQPQALNPEATPNA